MCQAGGSSCKLHRGWRWERTCAFQNSKLFEMKYARESVARSEAEKAVWTQ
jgi:hypothetical protein